MQKFCNLNLSRNKWYKCRKYLSNKHAHRNSKTIKNYRYWKEKDREKHLLKNNEIVLTFNEYCSSVVQNLNLYDWLLCKPDSNLHILSPIISSFKLHPSIINIRQKFISKHKFSWKQVSVTDTSNVIKKFAK